MEFGGIKWEEIARGSEEQRFGNPRPCLRIIEMEKELHRLRLMKKVMKARDKGLDGS